MPLGHILPQGDGVHDGKTAGARVVVHFELAGVLTQQTPHARGLACRGAHGRGLDHGVDVAPHQQLLETLTGTHHLHVKAVAHLVTQRHVHRHYPGDVVQIDAVIVLQQRPRPQARTQVEAPHADPPSGQVSRRLDARRAPAEDVGMPEAAVVKNRNGHERNTLGTRGDERRHAHLADVESLVVKHAQGARILVVAENSGGWKRIGYDLDVVSRHLDAPVQQRTGPLVFAAR